MLEKARLLLDQGRLKDAEKEIAKALSQTPDDDEAHGLLARLNLDAGHPQKALEAIQEALRLQPDEDYYLYLQAFAFYKLNRHMEAKSALNDALAVNPYSPAYFSLYAFMLLEEKDFAAALDKANEGLALDAEDIGCLNARARALNKMGKTDDAVATMQDSLAADPENDFTHTTVGWNFLEKGQHKLAARHFKESLRINPSGIAAREGMKEALKSKIAPYRWFLMYGMWLGNKGRSARIAMTVGLYIGFRLLASVAKQLDPPFNYMVLILVGLYFLAVLVSWLIEPLANFFLCFHPEGKYALTRSEKINSQSVVAALAAGIAMFFIQVFLPSGNIWQEKLLFAALTAASLAFPLAQVEYPLKKGETSRSVWIAAGLAALGLLGLVTLFFSYGAGIGICSLYLILLVIGSWVSAFSRS